MNPTADPTLVLEAFDRNGEVNAALLASLSEADLELTDGRGGWTVGQHLGHLADFRYGWLSRISPPHAEGLPSVIEGDDEGFWLTTRSLADLATAFTAGDAAARTAVLDALEEGRTFEHAYRSHPAHFLVHTVVHDAHHRGPVLGLLRAAGRTPEQVEGLEDAMWPVWRR